MKKTLITTATAFALLATPFINKADAASFDHDQNKTLKVQTYEFKTSNAQDLQAFIDQVLSKYHLSTNNLNQLKNTNLYQAKPTTPSKTEEQAKPTTPSKTEEQAKPTTPSKPVEQTKPTSTTQEPTTPNQQASYQLNAYEQQVVDLTNKERAKYGLTPLKVDTELSKVARTKSEDMSSNKYFDHTSPTYGSPFDMMKKFGITYRAAGENIAMGQRTPEEVVNAWMNSEGHRANILNKSFTHIGVGYVENGNYWTQEFIGK